MANHDANHSSTERTILWTIVPVAIGLTLLFTRLNNSLIPESKTELSGDLGIVKKERVETAPAVHSEETHEH